VRRLAIVLSHAMPTRGVALRELQLAEAMRARGVDARLWRIRPDAPTERLELRGVPCTLCPADRPEARVHHQRSAALAADVAAFAPDVVLYKGLGYRISAQVQAARPEAARYGFIVGGGVRDPLLAGASVVLGEYPEQLERHFPDLDRADRAMVLPKAIDIALAGDGTPPPAETAFDIVNVGSFAEPRKNQGALLPFGRQYRIALVGGGPLLEPLRQEAADLPNIRFLGRLPGPGVFAVLKQSRIMVHTSTGDGLPRATVEAMACGLPVIAFRSTIQGGIPPDGGLLVAADGLSSAIDRLLGDDALRRQMGQAARTYVMQHHGPAAIAAAAGRALDLLRAR
jgi:glycosyltransferase involved in cell wall biosynthesis